MPAPGGGLHHYPRPPVGRKMAEEPWQSPLLGGETRGFYLILGPRELSAAYRYTTSSGDATGATSSLRYSLFCISSRFGASHISHRRMDRPILTTLPSSVNTLDQLTLSTASTTFSTKISSR